MKTFKEYLTEASKLWKFKIKKITNLTSPYEQCDSIEKQSTKYDLKDLVL